MSNTHHPASKQQYLVGIFLAIVLTAIPFVLVANRDFSYATTMAWIAALAGLQILVHLRYFLHLSFSPKDRWFALSIAFTFLIIGIMVGGTIWVVADLNQQMMAGM